MRAHGFADRSILLRRLADDARKVHRIAPVRHRPQTENRERRGVRIVAEMVAERALHGAARRAALRPRARTRPSAGAQAFTTRRARRAGVGAPRSQAANAQLVDALGQRGHGRDQKAGVGADGDRHRQRLPAALGHVMVEAAALLDLPVHAGLGGAVQMHAIEAEIALAGLGIGGEHEAEGDEAPAVAGPAAGGRAACRDPAPRPPRCAGPGRASRRARLQKRRHEHAAGEQSGAASAA